MRGNKRKAVKCQAVPKMKKKEVSSDVIMEYFSFLIIDSFIEILIAIEAILGGVFRSSFHSIFGRK